MSTFCYSLNTSTIRGQGLTLEQEMELAAKAGYHGVEPWVAELEKFVAGGGKLADLRKRISDLGLTVEGSVRFSEWCTEAAADTPGGLEP